MTYQQTLEYLDSLLNHEQAVAYRYPQAFSLDRMHRFLERLRNPHRRYPSLHVAGTKGKGSTCAFLASILRSAGLQTGLYTSPHLFDFRERLQVDGTVISETELADVVNQIRLQLEEAAPGASAHRPFVSKELTYFEITTACAFLWFAQRRVDAAVVEVGLGGRLDATNLLHPDVTVLTPIDLDHLSKLGSTLGQIAREKAGILKPEVPAVVAPQKDEAADLIRRVAGSVRSPLHWVEQEIRTEEFRFSTEGTRVTFRTPTGTYRDLTVPLLGRHQVMNAAAALRAAELFSKKHPDVRLEESAVRRGIQQTEWPGRCQLIPGDPPILLDGAQSGESARALRRTVEELFPDRKVCLIVGVSTDKDLEGMAAVWGPWADRIFLTQAEVSRAESVERLENAFRKFSAQRERAISVEAALRRARETAVPGELLVVSGSLFVVAEALRFMNRPVSVVAAGVGPGTEPPPEHPRA